jgi:SAM-dependent methyltransferase
MKIQQQSLRLRPTSWTSVHSAKRGKRERNGVHAWHPYYAGYAEQFVEDVLLLLAQAGDTVLDPWNGSGTTTLVAQRMGYEAIGLEINPVMALHARAKNLHLVSDAENLRRQAEDIVDRASGITDISSEPIGSIEQWVLEEPLRALLALRQAIEEEASQAFFLSALFQVLRKVGSFKRGSNPTWIVPDEDVAATQTKTVFRLFIDTIGAMLVDLELFAKGVDQFPHQNVSVADSRRTPLPSSSVDLVITSPAYCTRIDYVISTKPELLLLGYAESEVDALRRETMGAPVIVDKTITPVHEEEDLLRGLRSPQERAVAQADVRGTGMREAGYMVEDAVHDFWATRTGQARRQSQRGVEDRGSRSQVTGGRQMDGFAKIIVDALIECGLSSNEIHYRTCLQLPGYYRPEKQWDVVVVADQRLVVAVELKSQVGSFGNNLNTRCEEAIGNAVDLWTAYREGRIPATPRPWLGYLMLLQDSPESTTPVRVFEPHYRRKASSVSAPRHAPVGARLVVVLHAGVAQDDHHYPYQKTYRAGSES